MVIKKLIGILAITLVIGMFVAGCDNGSTNGNSSTNTNNGGGTNSTINGTYCYIGDVNTKWEWVTEYLFSNGDYFMSEFGYVTRIGTYTINGNNITIKINKMRLYLASYSSIGDPLNYIVLSDFFSTKEQCIVALNELNESYLNESYPGLFSLDNYLAEVDELIPRVFLPKTGFYSFNGNTLVLMMENCEEGFVDWWGEEPAILIKK